MVAEQVGARLCVIGGVRYHQDEELIHAQQGYVVEVLRPDMPEPDVLDPTEISRKRVSVDARVINDGTLNQLNLLASKLLTDIRAGSLQAQYQAHAF